MSSRVILTAFFALTIIGNIHCDEPIVTTELGQIQGRLFASTNHTRSYYSFRGIRYGKAPINNLRFEAPQPAEPWEDVFNATEDGPACIQPPWIESDEDCLRLNVYTEQLPGVTSPEVKRPVILFIHPGGYYELYGRSDYFGPEYFMNKDVVLVTINYRLGSLGFLSTGTKNSPGNMGLKDQVMAMKWVKQHVAKFGGDPDNVSIMGYSAGGWSASLHMVSPMSRGLFHKVIAMSGAFPSQWQIPGHQIDLARRQARLLNVTDTEDLDALAETLRGVDAVDFGATFDGMFDLKYGPILLYSAVVEPDFGQERFLVEDPLESFQKGDFMKVPIITGFTRDEFFSSSYYLHQNEEAREQLANNFTTVAPILLMYERDTNRSVYISNELEREFMTDQDPVQGYGYLVSDACISFGVHKFVEYTSKYTQVYYYEFAYEGRFSYFMINDTTVGRVVHHDDLLYLFYIPPVTKDLFISSDPEHAIVEKMTTMWTTFAHTGNPNYKNSDDPSWEPVEEDLFNYYEIDNQSTMKTGLNVERFAVWSRLFPHV